VIATGTDRRGRRIQAARTPPAGEHVLCMQQAMVNPHLSNLHHKCAPWEISAGQPPGAAHRRSAVRFEWHMATGTNPPPAGGSQLLPHIPLPPHRLGWLLQLLVCSGINVQNSKLMHDERATLLYKLTFPQISVL